jgi:amino acid transporter
MRANIYRIYTYAPEDQNPTPYPIINMFYNATGSAAATDFMMAILMINFTAGSMASLAAASRQFWAFARNHGVPFSGFFAPARIPFLAFRTG